MSEYIIFENETQKLILNEASGNRFNLTIEDKLRQITDIPYILDGGLYNCGLDLEKLKIMRDKLDEVISYFNNDD